MKRHHASLKTVRGAFLCVLLGLATLPAAAEESDLYTVAKLSVDVQAEDAVTAKEKALEQAKLRALHTVFRRIAPFNSFDRLPVVKPGAVDGMLEGFSVRREKNSATRYLATLDFTFNAQEVRRLLVSKSLPVTDQQGAPLTVLPVYVDNGKIDRSGRDPWRAAWSGLDLKHALVPVRLASPGASLSAESLSALMDGHAQAFVALRDRHEADKLVVAVAEPAADGAALKTRLFGIDHVGSFQLARNDVVHGNDMKSAAGDAAAVALGILQGRWKLVRLPAGTGDGDTPPSRVDILVEFSGMNEWRDIRARLLKVPGVQELDVQSLSARSAQVAFQFPGSAEQLSRVLAPQGLSLHGGEGSWILRSN